MHRFFKLAFLAASIAVAYGQALAATPPATSWDLSGEFNAVTNNNLNSQVWTYGYNSGSTFVPFTSLITTFAPQQVWGWQSGNNNIPIVVQNQSHWPSTVMPGTQQQLTLPARAVLLHPGFACERAVVRFTPPSAGRYRISGQFFGLDANGTATHTSTSIRLNGNVPVIFTGSVATSPGQTGFNPASVSSFTSTTVSLTANDRLDFEVGCGPAVVYGSTGLNALIERIE